MSTAKNTTFTVSHATMKNAPTSNPSSPTIAPRTDLGCMMYQRQTAQYSRNLVAHQQIVDAFHTTKATSSNHLCMVKSLLGEIQRYNLNKTSNSKSNSKSNTDGNTTSNTPTTPTPTRHAHLTSKKFHLQAETLLVQHFGTTNNNDAAQPIIMPTNGDGYTNALESIRRWSLFNDKHFMQIE